MHTAIAARFMRDIDVGMVKLLRSRSWLHSIIQQNLNLEITDHTAPDGGQGKMRRDLIWGMRLRFYSTRITSYLFCREQMPAERQKARISIVGRGRYEVR